MFSVTKSVIFLMLLSISKGETDNVIGTSSACDEIEEMKAELDDKYCWFYQMF